MWMGTAEGVMDKIKGGMPREWMEMIERENVVDEEGEIEMYSCVQNNSSPTSLAR